MFDLDVDLNFWRGEEEEKTANPQFKYLRMNEIAV